MKNLSNRQQKIIGLFLLISVLGVSIGKNIYNDYLLNNHKTKKTFALIIFIDDGKGVHQTKNGDFEFKIGDKKYNFNDSGDFTFLEIGDTVLIEYSQSKPNIARVVNKCFMKKYKGKCD